MNKTIDKVLVIIATGSDKPTEILEDMSYIIIKFDNGDSKRIKLIDIMDIFDSEISMEDYFNAVKKSPKTHIDLLDKTGFSLYKTSRFEEFKELIRRRLYE